MSKRIRFFFALWMIIAGAVGTPQCLADSLVNLRNDVEVKGMVVRLSDVFEGIMPGKDVEIAQAPAPGKQMVYDVNVLTRLAKKYDLDWKPQSLTDHVVVASSSTRITSDAIRSAVIEKVKEKGAKGEIDVSLDNRSLEVNLPADRSPDFTLENFTYDPSSKHFRTVLTSIGSGGTFTASLSGRAIVKRTVPVLARRLSGGTMIGASDIDWMLVPEERLNASVLTDSTQIIGRELRRDIAEGEVLHTHDVIPPRLVTRGSLVTLKIETPYMALAVQGKALQDGTQGDVVRVMNMQSNRMVEGTVDGSGIVRILTTQKFAEAAQ